MKDINKTLDKLYYVIELSAKQQEKLLSSLSQFNSEDDIKISILRHNPLTGIQGPVIKKLSNEVWKELSSYPYEIYESYFWMIYNMLRYPECNNARSKQNATKTTKENNIESSTD